MASVTPAAGEVGFMRQHLSGRPTHTTTVPKNPMPAQPEAPRIERIASVRILRGGAGMARHRHAHGQCGAATMSASNWR
jgi:hypothetical protein